MSNNTNSSVQKWVKRRLEVSITAPDGECTDTSTHTHRLRLTPLPLSSNENHVWPRGGKGGGFTPQTRCATSSGVAPLTDALRTHSASSSACFSSISSKLLTLRKKKTKKKNHWKSTLFLWSHYFLCSFPQRFDCTTVHTETFRNILC